MPRFRFIGEASICFDITAPNEEAANEAAKKQMLSWVDGIDIEDECHTTVYPDETKPVEIKDVFDVKESEAHG
jgi:hypothetical protein